MWTRRRGLTRLDVVFILLMTLFVSLVCFPPFANRCINVAYRTTCASHLRQIGQAMIWYAQQNGGSLPRTRWEPTLRQTNSFTKPFATNPFAANGPMPNDVTASLWLLVRGGSVRPDVFLCPSAERDRPRRAPITQPTALSNFPDPGYLGYSVINPCLDQAATNGGCTWSDSLLGDPNFALAADLSPGDCGTAALSLLTRESTEKEMQRGNSPNHWSKGQNVLYADGHVGWSDSPFAGTMDDNIYTRAALTGSTQVPPGPFDDQRSDRNNPFGEPAHGTDSIMLPLATASAWRHPIPWRGILQTAIAVGWYVVPAALTITMIVRVRQLVRRGWRWQSRASRRLRPGHAPPR